MTLCNRSLSLATGLAACAVLLMAAGAHAQDDVDDAPPKPDSALVRQGWSFLTTRNDALVYMKDHEVQGGPKLRKVWTLYDLPASQERDGFRFQSVASLAEYDCAATRARILEETFYEKSAAAGGSKPLVEPMPEWMEHSPGSLTELKWQYACRSVVR